MSVTQQYHQVQPPFPSWLQAGRPIPVNYDANFVVCSLDMVASLCAVLGASVDPLIAGCHIPLGNLLRHCLADEESSDVRQAAFALVGDLCKASVSHLAPIFNTVVETGLKNLEAPLLCYENNAACNNACWALGEMAVKLRSEQLQPFAGPVAERLAFLIHPDNRMPGNLIENAVITLGRVAWVCPEPLAPHLAVFIHGWCLGLRRLVDTDEKEHAFMGLCSLVRLNPEVAAASYVELALALSSWVQIKCEGLANEVVQVMRGLKQRLVAANQWEQAVARLNQPTQDKLSKMGIA